MIAVNSCLWVALLAITGSALVSGQITLSPDKAEVGVTKNVTIRCNTYAKPTYTKSEFVGQLWAINLWRMKTYATGVMLAKIHQKTGMEKPYDGLKVTGHLNTAADSYLQVVWPVAKDFTIGEYHCRIYGTNKEGSLDRITPPNVFIQEVKH